MRKLFFCGRLTALMAGGLLAAVVGRGQSETPTPQWRPVYHWTPATNWTNDPNGPIWLNGEYLLYNQQNPLENKWGHMSWGHATSKDLLRWKEMPVAIPEMIDKAKGDTVWIFSGSAVWDEHNTSGFCKNGGCLVAIYTGHQPNLHKESQWIAYSNDGGKSYTQYAKNPVIDLNKRDFRDPSVFWDKISSQWVMTVVLPAEHKARFYGSANLREWKLLSEFGPQGFTESGWECPSLIELPVEGGGKKWVLMTSAGGKARGTFMQYFVGNFDGKSFTNDNASSLVLPVDEGDCFYAAIPWNNMPHNEKILIGWIVPGKQATSPWTGQMSISRDLRLRKTAEGLRLIQEPAAIVKKGLAAPAVVASLRVDGSADLVASRFENAWWLEADLEVGAGVTAGLRIGRSADGVHATEIGYDAAKHELWVDRSKMGSGVAPDRVRQVVALPASKGKVHVEVLFDKSSLEVFVNHGEHVLTTHVFADKGATGCAAFARGGSAVIKNLRIWNMSKM
jgi:levanase/fructan beta-fructosidase